VQAAASPAGADLADALDQAVLGADLGIGRPAWWRVVGAAQWLLTAAAVVGGAWLVALALLGALRLPAPRTPYVGWLPLPTLLLLAGLALGLLLGVVVRAVAGAAARARGLRARSRLVEGVAGVAGSRVIGPVRQVLADHRATREALDAVMSVRPVRR
jgi:hypothetical protein